ncbi:alpha/beta fold hydrolase [Nocardiopsis sp. MG754419]|uniref:alpha/beta fold hydrolase n=1 Tax=Nocardiopsis sp. MG754419 TaxID=2259865 RepID=UPI001BA99044|nr:alpha/beta hydrolase [Nocardiopsis sp. MG754419]
MRGISVDYTDRGAGCPVLFLHGHPLDRTMWEPQVRALAGRGYRTIVPDLRGYGSSTDAAAAASLADFARDTTALLDHLGLDVVNLVGLSMGGQIALEMYRLFPDRVDSLTLVATDPRPESDRGRLRSGPTAAPPREERPRGHADDGLVGLMTGDNIRDLPEVADHVRAMMDAAPPEGTAAARSGRARSPDHRPLLKRISAPTLLMTGRHDAFTPPEAAEFMHVRIPDSVVEIIEGAGHLPNLERPDRFNEVLRRFLERVRTRVRNS